VSGTQADLLAVAEALAAQAVVAVCPPSPTHDDAPRLPSDHDAAAKYAAAAKVALEAAALVETIRPGEIAQALSAIQDVLEDAGVLVESVELEPAEFLAKTFESVSHWRREAATVEGMAAAYGRLRELCVVLERDFTAGDTETSRRLAARVHTALEEAHGFVQQAVAQEA